MGMQITSDSRRSSSGFTVAELLVAVAIIAVLISLAMIGLRSLRHKSWRANTHASLSQHVRVFHSYAADYSDRLPQLSLPTDMNFSLMGGGTKTNAFIGYFWTTQHWNIALADHYYNGRYKGKDFQTRSTLTGAGMTNLAYSASLMASPHYWDEMTRTGPSQ